MSRIPSLRALARAPRWSRLAAVVAFVGGGALLTGTPSGCGNEPSSPTENVCGDEPTCQTSLTILHTGDVHSRLFQYSLEITQVDSTLGLGTIDTVANVGGMAKMAYILGRERARSDRVVHLN